LANKKKKTPPTPSLKFLFLLSEKKSSKKSHPFFCVCTKVRKKIPPPYLILSVFGEKDKSRSVKKQKTRREARSQNSM